MVLRTGLPEQALSRLDNLERDFAIAYGRPGEKVDADTWARLHAEFKRRAPADYPAALRWLFDAKPEFDLPAPRL